MEGIGKTIFYLSLAVMISCLTYLIWVNPAVNYPLEQQRQAELREQADIESASLREWKYSEFSDVSQADDKYPIVVLRTGFKVIRSGSDTSLVGWKYEIINTSPTTRYVPTVNFTLQDQDTFEIESGTGTSFVDPQEYETITGTININNNDLERLSASTWTISLSPNWESSETNTKGTRYERLANVDSSTFPYWTNESAETQFFISFSPKWQAIRTALGLDFEESSDADEKSN
jgi:hypothetical protein